MAASLPSGLKCKKIGSERVLTLREVSIPVDISKYAVCCSFQEDYSLPILAEEIVPIIRPFSDLTKECVQADYNDGSPFIPIVELAKIAYPKADKYVRINKAGKCIVDTYENYEFTYSNYDNSFTCTYMLENRSCHVSNQLQLFQLLIKWHFWPDKPENEEVIYVDENFNPYK